jgi:hypothetical protein
VTKFEVLSRFEHIGELHRDDGDGLRAHEAIVEESRSLLPIHRHAVLAALQEYLLMMDPYRTHVALDVATKLSLLELKPDIQKLRKEIGTLENHNRRRIFEQLVDSTLKALNPK